MINSKGGYEYMYILHIQCEHVQHLQKAKYIVQVTSNADSKTQLWHDMNI